MLRRACFTLTFGVSAGCQLVSGLAEVEIVDTAGSGGAPASTASSTSGANATTTTTTGTSGGTSSSSSGGGGTGGGGGAGGGPPGDVLVHDFGAVLDFCVLAQNDSAVFFTDALLGPGQARIWKAEKTSPVTSAIVAGEAEPVALWATESHLYWAVEAGTVIRRAALTNLTLKEDFVTGVSVSDLEVDAKGDLFWGGAAGLFVSGVGSLEAGYVPRLDTTTAADVFFVSSDQIRRVPKGGGSATLLLTASLAFVAVGADATYAFGADLTTGAVHRVSHDGTGATTVMDVFPSIIRDLAVDPATDDLFVGTGDGQLIRGSKLGGATTIIGNGSDVGRVLVDATSVTWCDAGNGRIWRTPR